MIYCIIDGVVGYPSTTDKIKITLENQYINDSGTYTYDVNFPMTIIENQVLFKNINRFDIRKDIADYEDCKLYANNRLLISGKGVVTSITNDLVKLQIVGGKSRIKYNAKFSQHYIDEIEYPDIEVTHGLNMELYSQVDLDKLVFDQFLYNIYVDFTKDYFVGKPGVVAFNPIYDETNGCISNNIMAFQNSTKMIFGKFVYSDKICPQMYNIAPQPCFLYVLNKVLESEGYKLIQNDFDGDPWNKLLIANAKRGLKIKNALPHWSVYTFLEEVRKFFNASILFDDINHTVKIISINELANGISVSYDCIDEYSEEYDEEGLKNLLTSNVEYNFSDSANRDWKEYIPQQVFKDFALKEYSNHTAFWNDINAMTDKEKKTTIFKVINKYYVIESLPSAENPSIDIDSVAECGYFNEIIRDINSEDSVKIMISPAAMILRKKWLGVDVETDRLQEFDIFPHDNNIFLPSSTNNKQGMISGDDEYVTVQDAIQNGTDVDNAEATEEVISVIFQRDKIYNEEKFYILDPTTVGANENTAFRMPITYTEIAQAPGYTYTGELPTINIGSLRLENNSRFASNSLQVASHNIFTIKFISSDIPDPTLIYNFKNKKFICNKIELEVSQDGVDDLKTGYFYEIL